MKQVIDGVYETDKMKVQIESHTVIKLFKNVSGSNLRYKRERKALQCLSGVQYFPNLISFNDAEKSIKMSRLLGEEPDYLSKNQIYLLREMVLIMHDRGVARHAMPIRDLISRSDEDLGMVDFERVTLRNFPFSPIWFIAKKVTNYHLYRLIFNHQPQLLTNSEKKVYSIINKIRDGLRLLIPIRDRIKRR